MNRVVFDNIFENAEVPEAKAFKYESPPEIDKGKRFVWLARSDILVAAVQQLREGGENNLHSHSSVDGFWMVLSGRVRFYGENDVLLGEFGKHEGIMVPRNFRYWFESVGSETLELLQVEARVAGKTVDRIDHSQRKPGQVVNAQAGAPS
jgi:mannose-6-phosphate isomerase-like protein (cupin superfamily)